MIPVVIATAGTTINAMLTKKVPLIVGWMGGFAIQAFLRHWIWHVALYSALGPMTGIAFVLFTNYMISDPGTTPFKAKNQFMFGSSVAVVYGVLMLFNVVYTLFFAVCIVCLVRGIGWWVAHLINKSKQRKLTLVVQPPATELPAAAGRLPREPAAGPSGPAAVGCRRWWGDRHHMVRGGSVLRGSMD
jgi:enediyne biosynthesis protein E5